MKDPATIRMNLLVRQLLKARKQQIKLQKHIVLLNELFYTYSPDQEVPMTDHLLPGWIEVEEDDE